MKTIFDQCNREHIIKRVEQINENNKAQWGKMNVHQMLSHCIKYEQMMQGKITYNRLFIGYLFGKSALKKDFLKDNSPIKQNVPTLKQLKPDVNLGDFNEEKNLWIRLIEDYNAFPKNEILHPFFGKLSSAEVGQLAYKHSDHHLRQFGV